MTAIIYDCAPGIDDVENPPMHDPCALSYVIDPRVMATRTAPVSVSLTGPIGSRHGALRNRASADTQNAAVDDDPPGLASGAQDGL